MRRHLIGNARANGFQVVDMQTAFVARYTADGKRFEWEHDGHWNALGHGACFEEITQRGFPDLGAQVATAR